jgi:hypothetical protein
MISMWVGFQLDQYRQFSFGLLEERKLGSICFLCPLRLRGGLCFSSQLRWWTIFPFLMVILQ